MMKNSLNIAVVAFSFMFTLSSCAGDGEKTPSTRPSIESSPIESEPVMPAESQVSNVLTLEGNDQMQYNKTELRVQAGKEVTLTLKHVGKIPKTAMGHNFVLLKPGADLKSFDEKALTAKDNDYIPKSESGSILAHTKLLGGGESDTITFTVTKGTYDFLCSFPGHAAMMKGKLIAE